jgi:hypothetical protein
MHKFWEYTTNNGYGEAFHQVEVEHKSTGQSYKCWPELKKTAMSKPELYSQRPRKYHPAGIH